MPQKTFKKVNRDKYSGLNFKVLAREIKRVLSDRNYNHLTKRRKLLDLIKKTPIEKRMNFFVYLEKIHQISLDEYLTHDNEYDLGVRKISYCEGKICELRGIGIFSYWPTPEFSLIWFASFMIVDEKKAWKSNFLNRRLFYHRDRINDIIQNHLQNYIFEVGEKNSVSEIYEAKSVLDKNLKILPEPKYGDLVPVFEEIKDIIDKNFNEKDGVGLISFSIEEFFPLDKLHLGLWELKKLKQKEDLTMSWEEAYKPILDKIEQARTRYLGNEKESQAKIIPEKKRIKINFYGDEKIEILPEGTEKSVRIIKPKQTIPFFKHWVELCCKKEKLHWLHGFIIYEEWRKNPPPDPLKVCTECVSLLKNPGHKTGLWEIKQTGKKGDRWKKGFWVLDTNFASNISKTQDCYEEAENLKNILEKEAKMTEVLKIYPVHLDAYLWLVQYWEQEKFENIQNEKTKQARNFLTEKANIYENALIAISNERKNREAEYWHKQETSSVIDEIEETYRKLGHCARVLKTWHERHKPLSLEDESCERIKELIEKVMIEKSYDKSYNLLLKEPFIKKVCGSVLHLAGWDEIPLEQEVDLLDLMSEIYSTCKKIKTEKTKIISYIYESFYEKIVDNEINGVKLESGDLEGFKNYIINILHEEVKKKQKSERPDLKTIPFDDSRPLKLRLKKPEQRDIEADIDTPE